ncbi:aspartate aminotransferase family protein [Nocardioides sp. CBS4Y-1]|uniref:Aspartate aminotransferase family protein n=1 Tax=Nocardioides acrostichi TaxID=2784339 RepID=A0A930UU38_9ACTN|nr:aspartate aminotransferase family protein [Nocardioides acrostichi]
MPGELHRLRAHDLPVHTGHTLAYVFDSGLPDVDRAAAQAVAAFASSNALDPTAFPSLLEMENDLVGFGLSLVDAPEGAVGTVTSGGTESCLLAVQGARDARPGITHPNMVVAETAHPAFHKAAHYFGVEARVVPVREDCRADPDAMAAVVDDDTVLLVASAPSYAHGVIDPVPEVAAIAVGHGIRCHVDACIGGLVLPFAARLGRPVPPWTFAIEGVTSISADLHKYGYAPKGTSLLLHRSAEVRRPQLFTWARWHGYPMLNSTMQSTRSGGPPAGAWTVVRALGADGLERLTETTFTAVDRIVAEVTATPGVHVVAPPDSTLVAIGTDDTCDPFTICDAMTRRGWHVQPQFSWGGRPPTIHLSVSAATAAHLDDFAQAWRASVAEAVAAGPVQVDPGIAAYLGTLDPGTLTPEEFEALLAAAGMGADDDSVGAPLPEDRAAVNALIEVAPPALREAVLKAFLDRLSRPSGGLL